MLILCSCIHEFSVIDNSFEFNAAVIYDEGTDQHRLTLTRVSGCPDNTYEIAFTLDGESIITMEDMEGRVHEGKMNETFGNVSARTYTLSKVKPGEHTLNLEINRMEPDPQRPQ